MSTPRAVCRNITLLMATTFAVGGGVATLRAGPPAATQPSAAGAPRVLFDGKSLDNWKSIDFAGGGEPRVEGGGLILPAGERLTGVAWTGPALPKQNYEISLQARRVDGADFFCGLTFPVDDAFATLVIGGWGGSLCGVSSFDDEDAAHNDTKTFQRLELGKWYRIRLRVTPGKIQAWLDDKQIVDASTQGKKVGLRGEMDDSKPLGLTSFQTQAELKDVTLTPYAAK